MRPSTDWRTSQRSYPAIHGTNQLVVTPEEIDEALQAYAELLNREILAALKAAIAFIGQTQEYKTGHSGAGDIVRNGAVAIALTEGRQ